MCVCVCAAVLPSSIARLISLSLSFSFSFPLSLSFSPSESLSHCLLHFALLLPFQKKLASILLMSFVCLFVWRFECSWRENTKEKGVNEHVTGQRFLWLADRAKGVCHATSVDEVLTFLHHCRANTRGYQLVRLLRSHCASECVCVCVCSRVFCQVTAFLSDQQAPLQLRFSLLSLSTGLVFRFPPIILLFFVSHVFSGLFYTSITLSRERGRGSGAGREWHLCSSCSSSKTTQGVKWEQ